MLGETHTIQYNTYSYNTYFQQSSWEHRGFSQEEVFLNDLSSAQIIETVLENKQTPGSQSVPRLDNGTGTIQANKPIQNQN